MRVRHREIDRATATGFPVVLAAIAAAGLVWRVTYVLWMRHVYVGGDGPYYHYGAIYLVEGHGFVDPFARLLHGVDIPGAAHPPAWIVVLAGPTALGLRSLLSHQLVAAVIGTLTIVMTAAAGRIAFGRRTGLIAAAIAAVYPNVWLYEREVAAETLVVLGVAVTIFLAYRYRRAPSGGGAILLGVAVAALALARSEQITLVAFLMLPLVLSTSSVSWRARLRRLAMAGAACVLVIAPWAIYNSTRFDRPVPLAATFGTAMRQGNCATTYSGELLGYYSLGCLLPTKGLSQDPSVVDNQYLHRALDFMDAHRSRVPIVMAARVGRTFDVYRPFQQLHLARHDSRTEFWVLRLGLYMYWAMLPLAAFGIAIARRRRVPVFPLLAFPATVLVAVILTIGDPRYRASAEIPLVLLAAVALDAALGRLQSRLARHERTFGTAL